MGTDSCRKALNVTQAASPLQATGTQERIQAKCFPLPRFTMNFW